MWKCSGDSNDQLVDNLVKAELVCSAVVELAMRRVDRALFVPKVPEGETSASYTYGPYADAPQSLGWKSTVSAPWIHAVCLEQGKDFVCRPNARVLDVGSGSGILLAYFANMSKDALCVGVEIVAPLVEKSKENLTELLNEQRVLVRHGDGWAGCEEFAPYDFIHVGACAEQIPETLVGQLKPGGRLVIPLGKHTEQQQLTVIDKTSAGEIVTRNVCLVRFVPLQREGVDWNSRYRKSWAYGKDPNKVTLICVFAGQAKGVSFLWFCAVPGRVVEKGLPPFLCLSVLFSF